MKILREDTELLTFTFEKIMVATVATTKDMQQCYQVVKKLITILYTSMHHPSFILNIFNFLCNVADV